MDDDRAGLAFPVEVPEGRSDQAQVVDMDGASRSPGDSRHPVAGRALDLPDLVLEAFYVVTCRWGLARRAGVRPRAPEGGRDRQGYRRNSHAFRVPDATGSAPRNAGLDVSLALQSPPCYKPLREPRFRVRRFDRPPGCVRVRLLALA